MSRSISATARKAARAWVCLAVLLAAGPAWAQDQAPAALTGLAKAHLSYIRLEGVRVTAIARDTGQTYQGVTDVRGYYGFSVAPGIYDLAFHHPDYIDHWEGPVAVRDNSAPDINPVLIPLDALGSTLVIGNIFYPDAWPAHLWTVRAVTDQGAVVAEGLTDDLGAFTLDVGASDLTLTLEFYNQDNNLDGYIHLTTTDRTARILATVHEGYRNEINNDKGPGR